MKQITYITKLEDFYDILKDTVMDLNMIFMNDDYVEINHMN